MVSFWKKHSGAIVTLIVAVVAAGIILWYESGLYEWTLYNVLHMLSDAAFVPGVFMFCFGIMILISDAGAFDALAYLGHMTVSLFSPRRNRFQNRMKYIDYKLEKQRKRVEHGRPPVYVLTVGAVLLVVSIVLAVLCR